MAEEDIESDPYDQVNQRHHIYIGNQFQIIINLGHHTHIQHFLISSQLKKMISHILVYIKAYISNLHMRLFSILVCAWIHWNYSYTLNRFLFFSSRVGQKKEIKKGKREKIKVKEKIKSQVKTSFEAHEIASLIENFYKVVNGLEKIERK